MVETSYFNGDTVQSFCNFNYLADNSLSYGLLIIIIVGIFWFGRNRNYSLYTLLPIASVSAFFVSLMIYSLDCTNGVPIDGRFVVIFLIILSISLALRKVNNA
ncbi:MAG: hypothetical protein D4S01_07240 [Dehalococcoidia bacterium]|nr:MAG: hypothetical protein D4S01_07240 [Dehalococcoidia bacterium]